MIKRVLSLLLLAGCAAASSPPYQTAPMNSVAHQDPPCGGNSNLKDNSPQSHLESCLLVCETPPSLQALEDLYEHTYRLYRLVNNGVSGRYLVAGKSDLSVWLLYVSGKLTTRLAHHYESVGIPAHDRMEQLRKHACDTPLYSGPELVKEHFFEMAKKVRAYRSCQQQGDTDWLAKIPYLNKLGPEILSQR